MGCVQKLNSFPTHPLSLSHPPKHMSPRSHGAMLLLLLLFAFVASASAFLPLSTRTIGNITYGPGVCGATLDCATPSWGGTPFNSNSGVCGVDYVCNGTSLASKCLVGGGCECWDNCIGGGLCSIHQKDKVAYLGGGWVTPTVPVTCSNVTATVVNASLALVAATGGLARKEQIRAVALTAVTTPEGLLPCGGRCDNTTQACVRQSNPGVSYQRIPVDGVLRNVMNSEVCCPRGWKGDACHIPVGCSEGGCDHGGQCLRTTATGVPLAARDMRCFGCPPGNNVTGPGWGGAFCHIRNTPTFVVLNTTTTGRRLLAVEEVYRASQLRNTAASGAIFQEPSRTCDCAVRWNDTGLVPTATLGVLLMGNVSVNLADGNATLLSTIKFGWVDGVLLAPYWHRRVRTIDEAKWLCSRDWGSGGFYLWTSTADATFIGSMACVADPELMSADRAAATVTPANSPSLFPSGPVRLYTLDHIEDAARCPSATLDRDYYCNTYPTQCAAVIESGGVGNKRIPAGLTQLEQTRLAAVMHFSLFGHLVRNSPNAACDLTSNWAEDETGCVNLLRAPKSLFPLPANATLTPEVCGNISRIEPERIAFGPLQPLVTGTNVTDDGHSMCQCNPPFRPTDPAAATDCAYDLCGTVDGRGRVNATYVGTFNHSAAEACVCTGVWGTDPLTCSANTCAWCGSTICQNLGTVNGSDYTAACQCLPIFAGELCETSLCNATNTHAFNASLWEGQPPSTVVCDCLPGFTGTFCDDLQCVHGVYSFAEGTCTCEPGFYGPQCQHYRCTETHGLFVPSPDGVIPDSCDCFAPWTGATCEEHTCDADNVVLGIAGWNGVRPFGQPVVASLSGGPAMWECGCNFPYMPTAFSTEGRPLNCFESVCGRHGTPNANASNVLVPTDACTCSDPFNKGITTDPAHCTAFNYADCRTPCMVATCGLSQAEINNVSYVPIGFDDPSCCRCPASVGYLIKGECQPFCAFTQPCITSLTSSFLEDTSGINATSGLVEGDNTVRIAVGGAWTCACNAGFFNPPNADGLPCSIKLEVPRDSSQNVTGWDYGQAPPPLSGGGSGSSGSSSSPNTDTVAIGVAGGLVGAFLLAAAFKASVTAAPAVTADAVRTARTTTTTTVVSTVGTGSKAVARVPRQPVKKYARLLPLAVVLIVTLECHAVPLTFMQSGAWGATGVASPCSADVMRANEFKVNGLVTPGVQTAYPVVTTSFPTGIHGYVHPPDNPYFNYGTCHNAPWVSNPVTRYGQRRFDGHQRSYIKSLFTWGEYWHRFTRFSFSKGETYARVGDVHVRIDQLAWTLVSYSAYEASYGFTLNLMDETDVTRAFCVYGAREPRPMSSGDSFEQAGFARCGSQTSGDIYAMYPGFEYVCYAADDGRQQMFIQRKDYQVVGCRCLTGWGGVHCDVPCPDGAPNSRDLCNGHGYCASGVSTTSAYNMSTCLCTTGCRCDQGWTGDHCHIATQTRGPWNPQDASSLVLENFSTCCPLDSTDCSPLQVEPLLAPDLALNGIPTQCNPSTPCAADGICPCRMSTGANFPRHELLSVRVPAGQPGNPYKCGEGDETPYAGWTPERKEGNEVRGHGKCWIGMGTDSNMSPSTAYCICSNPNIYNKDTGALISQQRRGWFGPSCQFRTCTRRLAVSVPHPTTGDATSRDFVGGRPVRIRYGVLSWVDTYVKDLPPAHSIFDVGSGIFRYDELIFNSVFGDPAVGFPKQLEITYASGRVEQFSDYPAGTGVPVKLSEWPIQCSGHAAGQVNNMNFNYDNDNGPCNDKPIDSRTLNTRTGKPEGNNIANINSVGKCKACDHGWGLYANMNRFSLNGTTYDPSDWGICSERTYHSGAGAQCGGYGVPTPGPTLSIQGKTVPTVTGCRCDASWGLAPYKDSGICQRTCASDEVLLSLPASVRDQFGLYNGTVSANFTLLVQLSARCGGFRQGLCRPITYGLGREDGLNSACMCNAGYGGPSCTNLTSMWNQGMVCGLQGEAVLAQISPVNSTLYSTKGYADEAWFNQYIVPLNGPNITDPANAKLYTAYQCRCTPQATANGWALDTNGICAPTCSAIQLMGGAQNNTLCSGRGSCVTDTRLGGIGKACRCDFGWDGLNCGQRILHDKLGQPCGGADRGSLAHVPATANFTQQCVCNAGYTPSQRAGNYNGLCFKDCPYSAVNGLQCAGAAHGSCSVDLATGNDNICHCDQGAWRGATCEQKLVGVYTTASGTQIACSGHGLPHPDGVGACSCEPGWVGNACETYAGNRECGSGQCFFDAEAAGIVVG